MLNNFTIKESKVNGIELKNKTVALRDMIDAAIQNEKDLYYYLCKKVCQTKYSDEINLKEQEVTISNTDEFIIRNAIKNNGIDKVKCMIEVQEKLKIKFNLEKYEQIYS